VSGFGGALLYGDKAALTKGPVLNVGMLFDGVNDFADVISLGLGAPTEFTAMGFIRFTAIGRYDLFTTEAGAGSNGFGLALISNSFAYRASGASSSEVSVGFIPVIGTIYHVALVVTATSQLSVFVNGARVATGTIAVANQPSSLTRLRFGAGFIATPAVYANWLVFARALTPDEILLASRIIIGRVLPNNTNGLVAAYDFNSVSGATTPDSSGNGRNLTLNNMPADPIVTL
jgi:Concanavalin A-like lectin/glucanases superfamily